MGKAGALPREIEMRIVTILSTLTLASFASGAAHAAPALGCPVQPGKALEHLTVFDGPPQDMASLRPEDGREVKRRLRQTWTGLADSAKHGRQIHVECRYKGGATQVVKLPKTVRTCFQDLQRIDDKGNYRTLSFGCR